VREQRRQKTPVSFGWDMLLKRSGFWLTRNLMKEYCLCDRRLFETPASSLLDWLWFAPALKGRRVNEWYGLPLPASRVRNTRLVLLGNVVSLPSCLSSFV
jgi:hypothetical protein